jgi:glycosyltransferase involved in cell wall biosynthesis
LPYHLHISFSLDDSISLKISGLKSPFLKDDYSRSNLITEHFNSARYSVASFVKILLYTDIAIRPDQLFWHRDLGLLTKAFRALGHEAYLVVHKSDNSLSKIKHPTSKIPEEPVLWPSPSEVRNPIWWQSQKPDLVILGLWTRPKYNPIRRAALSATPHIIERADSDGMRTASCGLLTYAKRRFDYFRDCTYHFPSPLSIFASFFYSFASILTTPWIEYRLRKTLELLPSVLVETPHATALWKSLATRLGADPSKIHCVPHPIQTDIFKFDPTIQKKNQIISVGRWESYQKNLPLLLKTLCAFLNKNPTWTSLVIGSGLRTKSPHPQITFLPTLPPPDLARNIQASRIFFSSSRYESFGMAAAEAATCACAIVGPSEIFSQLNEPSFFNSPSNRLLAKLSDASSLLCNHPARPLSSFTPSDIAQQIIRLSQSIL